MWKWGQEPLGHSELNMFREKWEKEGERVRERERERERGEREKKKKREREVGWEGDVNTLVCVVFCQHWLMQYVVRDLLSHARRYLTGYMGEQEVSDLLRCYQYWGRLLIRDIPKYNSYNGNIFPRKSLNMHAKYVVINHDDPFVKASLNVALFVGRYNHASSDFDQ